MEKFEGRKWQYVEDVENRRYNPKWIPKNDAEKELVRKEFLPTFKMTKSYKKYLYEKRLEEQELELQTLKAKLEYQYKTYGEIDDADYAYYKYLLKTYKGINIE